MIRLHQIDKRFGSVVAVSSVSLEVGSGEIVGIVGPNGAGKTTTLRILTGFMEPDAGSATLAGVDVVADRLAAQHHLGYVPESAPLYPDMRVGEYLAFRARLKGVARAELSKVVDSAIDKVSLGERRRWLIGRLSRGLRQRVALADALLGDPKVLVLDEPTSGLDPLQVRQLVATLSSLREGRAIVVASHVLETLAELCDRLVVFSAGRVIFDGDVDGLRRQAGLDAGAALDESFAVLVQGASE